MVTAPDRVLPSGSRSILARPGEEIHESLDRLARAEAVIAIDQQPIVFDVLSQPGHWVGRAGVDGCVVTIEGYPFALGGLALVEITNLSPYILGTRQFEGGTE